MMLGRWRCWDHLVHCFRRWSSSDGGFLLGLPTELRYCLDGGAIGLDSSAVEAVAVVGFCWLSDGHLVKSPKKEKGEKGGGVS